MKIKKKIKSQYYLDMYVYKILPTGGYHAFNIIYNRAYIVHYTLSSKAPNEHKKCTRMCENNGFDPSYGYKKRVG